MTKQCYKPVAVRLTAEEKERLEDGCGPRSLAAHIRDVLLARAGEQRPRRRRRPIRDWQALAQLVATLGEGELSSHLRILAQAARSDSLALSAESLRCIEEAHKGVMAMRRMLMRALALQQTEES
ncbi:MAG: hypothetical protein M3N08_03170 [Pseudomonadota bacterium]|nr:hypothetical protein [Pseudomonadota bacterium]